MTRQEQRAGFVISPNTEGKCLTSKHFVFEEELGSEEGKPCLQS